MHTGNYTVHDCLMTMFGAFNGHVVFSHALYPTHAVVCRKTGAGLKDKVPFEIFICNAVPEHEIHLVTEEFLDSLPKDKI
jgi:hypothetical protein